MKITSAIALSASVIFCISGCQTHDKAAEEACKDISCPGGTTPTVVAESFSSCDYNLDYSLSLDGEEMDAGVACITKGSCKYKCEVLECDGNWTVTGPNAAGSYTYECEECEPTCNGKLCGPDGCGGECGICGEGEMCGHDGTFCCPTSAGDKCCKNSADCSDAMCATANTGEKAGQQVVQVEHCVDNECKQNVSESVYCGDFKCDDSSEVPSCLESCTDESQCLSGKVCIDNACSTALGSGEVCSDDSDCVSPLKCGGNGHCCPSGFSCCDDAGKGCAPSLCDSSDELEEHICQENVCQTIAIACSAALKCKDGACPSNCDSNPDCVAGHVCVESACLAIVGLGDSCMSNKMCSEGVCDSDTNICCTDNGKPCCDPDIEDSCGEIVCEGNTVNKTECEIDTSTCNNKISVETCEETVCVDGVGCQEGCNVDSDCLGDSVVCVSDSCVAKVDLGIDCTVDKMCNEGVCDPSTKICCSEIGACCTDSNSQCYSGNPKSIATSVKSKWTDGNFTTNNFQIDKDNWGIQAFKPTESGYLKQVTLGLKNAKVGVLGAKVYLRLYVQDGTSLIFNHDEEKAKSNPVTLPNKLGTKIVFHKVNFSFDNNIYIDTDKIYLLMLVGTSTKKVIWYYGKESSDSWMGGDGNGEPDSWTKTENNCWINENDDDCTNGICPLCQNANTPQCLKTTCLAPANDDGKDFYFTVKTVPAYCETGNFACCNTDTNICN